MSKKGAYFSVLALLMLLNAGHGYAELRGVYRIYHDADYSHHQASAESMLRGLSVALAQVAFELQGYRLQIVSKDHRGNSVRSRMHMDEFLADEQALFMLGGLHSPPYLQHREFINKSGLLLLVPWAAAGPITRYPDALNWVFRLSLDDSKVGYRLVQFARDIKQCRRPHLLLEETPWGQANLSTLSQAMSDHVIGAPRVTWFAWNTKYHSARVILRDIRGQGSDCLLFVGNAVEGEQFARAMLSLPVDQRMPIISHWGITGGSFAAKVPASERAGLDLNFVQSCFSFHDRPLPPLAEQALALASKLYPEQIHSPDDIKAPAGFIHAYDVGRLVVAALKQIQLTGNAQRDRAALRQALEQIQTPVAGLIKTYHAPFSAWSVSQQDAHEALGLADFCMAYYDDEDRIRLHPQSVRKEQAP